MVCVTAEIEENIMIGFAKIIGDLFGAYVVHIAGGIGAVVIASEAYHTLTAAAQPVITALN